VAADDDTASHSLRDVGGFGEVADEGRGIGTFSTLFLPSTDAAAKGRERGGGVAVGGRIQIHANPRRRLGWYNAVLVGLAIVLLYGHRGAILDSHTERWVGMVTEYRFGVSDWLL
jgi:hypothetical protein